MPTESPSIPIAALINLFSSLRLFKDLTKEEVGKLAELSKQRLYGKGEEVFKLDDIGIEAYVIVRGLVDVCLPNRAEPIAQLGSGQILGELAFLDGQTRTATAIAKEPSILMVIQHDAFWQLVDKEPHLGVCVMRNIAIDLAGKLRTTVKQFEHTT